MSATIYEFICVCKAIYLFIFGMLLNAVRSSTPFPSHLRSSIERLQHNCVQSVKSVYNFCRFQMVKRHPCVPNNKINCSHLSLKSHLHTTAFLLDVSTLMSASETWNSICFAWVLYFTVTPINI